MIHKGRIFGATDWRKGTSNVFCFIIVVIVRNRHRCAPLNNGVVIPFGDSGTTGAALQLNWLTTTDDYRTAGLRAQHYISTVALREQCFKLDILWPGILQSTLKKKLKISLDQFILILSLTSLIIAIMGGTSLQKWTRIPVQLFSICLPQMKAVVPVCPLKLSPFGQG